MGWGLAASVFELVVWLGVLPVVVGRLAWRTLRLGGFWVRVRFDELVSGLTVSPKSWTRAGHLFREKYSANTRGRRLLIR